MWARQKASETHERRARARGATKAAHHLSALRLLRIWGPAVWNSPSIGGGVCLWCLASRSRPGFSSSDDVLLNLRGAHGRDAQRAQFQLRVRHGYTLRQFHRYLCEFSAAGREQRQALTLWSPSARDAQPGGMDCCVCVVY